MRPEQVVEPVQTLPSTVQQVKLCSTCQGPLSLGATNSPTQLPDELPLCALCKARGILRSGDVDSAMLSLMDIDFDEKQHLGHNLTAADFAHHGHPDDDIREDVEDEAVLESMQDVQLSSTISFPLHPPTAPISISIPSSGGYRVSTPTRFRSRSRNRSRSPSPTFSSSSHSPPSSPIVTSPSFTDQHTTPPSSPLPSPFVNPGTFSTSSKAPLATLKVARKRHFTPPDPFVDITRLRSRSEGRQCLQAGATFCGTQKSGRNSYDVTVTIVDVDFSSSFLCGYLRIRNLTDDWPELTTYFDAEIIGSKYGFLTQDWGATEQEDMTHWARFPAFRPLKGELKKPNLTMRDRDRGVVFMRWKERFLVPDHKVRDINGASFAGFYYVCVEFNPRPQHHQQSTSPTSSNFLAQPQLPSTVSKASRHPDVCMAAPSSPPTATMTGFYFHQNSEPYQQLSLHHVPDQTTSTFEFR